MEEEATLQTTPVEAETGLPATLSQVSDGAPVPALSTPPPSQAMQLSAQSPAAEPSSGVNTPKSCSGSPEEPGQLSPELRFLKEVHDHLGRYKTRLLPVDIGCLLVLCVLENKWSLYISSSSL